MYKCKICGKKYTDINTLYNHIEQKHGDMIPKDMSVEQYYYFMKTGKRNGNCVMCKQMTTWNKNTHKYNRFCGNPRCKEKYVEIVKGRMIAKYGKVHLLNDPNKQREMLANRKISGKYQWSGSHVETTYTGSYELDFLKTLDIFFDWDPEDVSMPSPHTYTYEYEGEQKFYIPDAFIHSLDLEIEIKDGGDNPNNHYKIQAVDKEKERLKDEVMKSQKMFHYVKLTNKNYTNFFDFLKEVKDGFEKYGDDKKIPRIFKTEDIRTKSVVQESYDVLEEGLIKNKMNALNKRPYAQNMDFLEMSYELRKNDYDKLQHYFLTLAKNFNYEEDLSTIKYFIKKTFDHYNKAIVNNPDLEKEYYNFKKWINKPLTYEVKDRLRDIKESSEFIEEKFEPDKFLVWFDKPLQKLKGGKIKLYRGSSKLIEKEYIDPMSLNVGATKFSEPRWSSYFWDNREDAMCWEATWAVSEHHKYTLYMGHNGKTLLGKPDGVDDKTFVKDLIEKMSNSKFYIYECEVDIRDLEIGSVPTIKEYTVSKPVKILKRFEYKLNKEIVRRCFEILPVDEVIKYKEKNKGVKRFDLQRNFILNNILDRTRDSYRAIIRTDLQQGNINIGDDLSDYKYSINRHVKNDTYNLREEYTKESTEYVEENLLVSKDNLEFNLENFNQNNNILFITGLGGSGKSTIISEYATKYNAQPLEYDAVTSALIKGLENINRNKIHPIILDYLEKENPRKLNGFSDPNFDKECVKFLNWFEANYSNDGNLYVLEGMQIFLCFNPERFKDKPMVIMGTSVVKSMFRSVSRTYKRSHGDIIKTFKFFLKTIKRFPIFVKNDKQIDELIDTIQESYDDIYEDYIHESSISISHINKCLQQDTDRLLKQYLQDYTDFYHRMMKEQPASIPHINEDIKKAILTIDDLSKKENVNNDLLKSAKWCLGDLVNLNKNTKPIKHSNHTQSLMGMSIKTEAFNPVPNCNIWVGADWHFYTKYNDKLKENPNIDKIIRNFNKKIKKGDIVVFVGDLYDARRIHDKKEMPKLDNIKKLNGHKIFVKGNHDVDPDQAYYDLGFDLVCTRHEIGNLVFTHEPVDVNENQINIHGHLHYCRDYWYIKPKSHIDVYTARFNYQPLNVKDAVLKYNDGVMKPLALNTFNELFDVSVINESSEIEVNNNSILKVKVLYNPESRSIFTLNDRSSQIIINEHYVIQRDIKGSNCSITQGQCDETNRKILEFDVVFNDNINVDVLIKEKIETGVQINSLFNPNDMENRFIREMSLRLFGLYPNRCELYR